MGPIRDDIVGGFNEFLARQRETAGEARVTLVQFDSQDPFEVLIDGADLAGVADLDSAAYQPRSSTPLYDAVGRMIVRIDSEIARRSELRRAAEDQLVLIVTDGMENASTDFDRRRVFEMVAERRDRGWVFVLLGADQDVYAEGGKGGCRQPTGSPGRSRSGGARSCGPTWPTRPASTGARTSTSALRTATASTRKTPTVVHHVDRGNGRLRPSGSSRSMPASTGQGGDR